MYHTSVAQQLGKLIRIRSEEEGRMVAFSSNGCSRFYCVSYPRNEKAVMGVGGRIFPVLEEGIANQKSPTIRLIRSKML